MEGLEGEGVKWSHVDLAGTVEPTRVGLDQEKGMVGRLARVLVEYARRLSGEAQEVE